MTRDLKNARKSLADGRVDEALLFLWNALEPARLEGGRARRELERLATAAAGQGDESQREEAQRLLGSLRELPADVDAIERAVVEDAVPVEDEEDGPTEAPPAAAPGTPARRNLGRYAIPAIFLLIVVVNLLARALGD